LDSNYTEEVRKRRAKPSKNLLNVYQKIVLLTGVLTLSWIIGVRPTMASILALMVTGGTLFLLFLFKNFNRIKEVHGKDDPIEITSVADNAHEPQEFILEDGVEVGSDSTQIISEEKAVAVGEKTSFNEHEESAQKEIAQGQEAITHGKEPPQDLHESAEKVILSDFQQRIIVLEEKVTILEGILMSKKERQVDGQETELTSEPKIDFQNMLSYFNE
jgi:hypothetical protein